jgi:membrane peptidoglycan carboxypeptidase
MPTVTQTIKFRNQRRAKEQHNPRMRIGLALGIVLCLVGVLVSLTTVWIYSNLTRNLPSVDVLPSLFEQPDGILLRPTYLYDRTHEHIIHTLENPATAGKRYLQVGKEGSIAQDYFSKYLIDATVAASDPGIWKHPGFTITGSATGTHPTLAQQLVSDLVLIDEPASIQRNIRERLLAAQVTAEFGREKILEWYLNSTTYGDLIYGADAAAYAYFGKSATELSLAEAIMLVAISNAPAVNPISGSQVLKQQQARVIQAMLDNGMISTGDAHQALAENLIFQADQENNSISPAFVDLVLKQLSSQMSLERIRRGGFDIVTTLDYGLQMQAKCATEIQIDRIQGALDASSDMDVGNCEAAQLLPNLQLSLENYLKIYSDVVSFHIQGRSWHM